MLQMGHGENNTKKKMNFKFNAEHTFFTSDTHFNHANIISFCNRPFKDVAQMNEAIIEKWNSVIGADDTVFHLGDYNISSLRNMTWAWKTTTSRNHSLQQMPLFVTSLLEFNVNTTTLNQRQPLPS